MAFSPKTFCKSFFLLIVPLLITGCSQLIVMDFRSGDPSELLFLFQPLFSEDEFWLDVELKFRGDADGNTKIHLPTEWAGQNDLNQAIVDVLPLSERLVIQRTSDLKYLELTHTPKQIIHLKYRVKPYWQGSLEKTKVYKPVLKPKYFHLVGHHFLLVPDWDDNKVIRIGFSWDKFPSDWNLINSFGTNETNQDLEATIHDLRNSLYLGGDYQFKKFENNGQTLTVAVRGIWVLPAENLLTLIQTSTYAVRDFWQDNHYPRYLISLTPLDEPYEYAFGTSLHDSFTLMLSSFINNEKELARTVAHQYFRHWNGNKISMADTQEGMYWFTEGFTSYYSRLILLRKGLLTLEDYQKSFNESLKTYYFSPERNTTLNKVATGFWEDEQVRKIPYLHGDLLAHNWNADIRIQSKMNDSIDSVMREILVSSKNSLFRLSAENFHEFISAYRKSGAEKDIQNYLKSGNTIRPHSQALGPCYKLVDKEVDGFNLGFDITLSDKFKRVVGLWKNSNAYKAGLRLGQKIIERRIAWDDPHQLTELRILGPGNVSRTITYYPTGGKTMIPQYEPIAQPREMPPFDCMNWFK